MAEINPKLYHNKYRIESNRMRGWNYADNGHYFITIVTHKRKHYFGEIQDGKMILNDYGKIVSDCFFKSFEIRSELFLGEFVLMPNHLHAIVILDNPTDETQNTVADTVDTHGQLAETHGRDTVETHGRDTVETHGRASRPYREPKSISSFVAGFKSSTINAIDDWIDAGNGCAGFAPQKFNRNNPLWQANYHDHIIRNEMEYQRIANYIVNNPLKWKDDTLKMIKKCGK